MTKTRSRSLRDQRVPIASHFKIVEVPMKSLNDPLPPYHAPSPDVVQMSKFDDLQYYKIDLSQLKLINNDSDKYENLNEIPNGRAHSRYYSGTNGHNDDLYPSVSHGTKNLLREVENIRQQYRGKTSKYLFICVFCMNIEHMFSM